jgi:hypothetical protein
MVGASGWATPAWIAEQGRIAASGRAWGVGLRQAWPPEYGGQSVGLIQRPRPAAEVVADLVTSAELLRRTGSLT